MWRALCVAAGVVVGIVVAAPSSSAATQAAMDTARLAAAGVDVDELRPGWSLVGDEVWWDGGDVRRMLAPDQACPVHQMCVYSEPDLKGQALAFSAAGFYYYMPEYGFNDTMESWVNTSPYRDARWYYHVGGTSNPSRCMGAGLGREHLPAADDNQMSTVYLYYNATAC